MTPRLARSTSNRATPARMTCPPMSRLTGAPWARAPRIRSASRARSSLAREESDVPPGGGTGSITDRSRSCSRSRSGRRSSRARSNSIVMATRIPKQCPTHVRGRDTWTVPQPVKRDAQGPDSRHSGRPLFTICLPTIGRTAFLGTTIQSIEAQTLDDYEVLLLDNASPKEAAGMLATYAARDPRVRLLRSEVRLHMFDNFARGVVAASGRFLAFFHDDDVYGPEFLARHAALLESDDRIAFSGSNCRL